MSPLARIPLLPGTLNERVAELVRTTRTAIGWSQDELADRALTSQTKIWRIEHTLAGAADLETLDRVLTQLGLRVTLEIEGRHLAQRVEQRDIVHALLVGALASRLRRAGWLVASEVATGSRAPTGWIDLLAFREADAALLMSKVKAAIPDVGGLQRQVRFYEREAVWAARREGWQPATTASLVACLDSAEVADVLTRNRSLLAAEFPGNPVGLEAWLLSPNAPRPRPRTMAAIDLAHRRRPGLRRTALTGRRSAPVYGDYAAAARSLIRPVPRRAGRPHRRPPSGGSRPR